MKSYALFQEYIWLVNTIHKARKITLEEINRKWVETEMSEGIPMVRSTFNRHKDAIEDMFGIYIECDRRDGFKYHIGNPEVLEEDSIQNWMLSTLSVSSILSESKAVSDRILLESVPSDGENLHCFIEAMKKGVCVIVRYHRYDTEFETSMKVEPYFVKLFNRRWYALVRAIRKGSFFILSFDRMTGIELTDERFELEEGFDAASWFSQSYGIVRNDDVPVERIRLRVYGAEANYLRDLPLHPSQNEIERTDKWSDFELTLRPTADFLAPILSRGSLVKVLEPQWLADEIRIQHQAAADIYSM